MKRKDKVCLLKKALYRLRQASRRWHVKLSRVLKDFGLKSSSADPCVFYAERSVKTLLATTYVDDILVTSHDTSRIAKLTKYLSRFFQILDLGEISYCLGIEFRQEEDRILIREDIH